MVWFNCLYRWHVMTSLEEEQLIKKQFENLFPEENPEEVSVSSIIENHEFKEDADHSLELLQDSGYHQSIKA